MTDLPVRPANRLRRPSWRDTRLLAGIVLVLGSTVAGSLLVARADHRVPMYAARVPVLPGDRLSGDNLQRIDVQLGEGASRYLSAQQGVPDGSFALREIRPGELVPTSAVGDSQSVAVQAVTVQADGASASVLVHGSVVDVYVDLPKPGGSTGDYQGATKLLTSVSIAADPAQRTGFGVGVDRVPVQVLAPKESVEALINAIDKGARITVVPVPGSPLRGTA